MKEIVGVAKRNRCRVIAILVPSSIQSADLAELNYLLKGISLEEEGYDIDQPQRLLIEICKKLKVPVVDLRELFERVGGKGIYQPYNMHWTEKGHRLTTEWIAEKVAGPR